MEGKIAKIKQKAVADGFTEDEVNNLLNLAAVLVGKVVKEYMLWYIKDELCKDAPAVNKVDNGKEEIDTNIVENVGNVNNVGKVEIVESIEIGMESVVITDNTTNVDGGEKSKQYKELFDGISKINVPAHTGSQKIQFKNAPDFVLTLQAGIFQFDKPLSLSIPPQKNDKEHKDACALIFAHMDKLANMINSYYKTVFIVENKNLYLRLANAIPDTDFSSFKINPNTRAMRFAQKDNTSRSAMSVGPVLYYVDKNGQPLVNM